MDINLLIVIESSGKSVQVLLVADLKKQQKFKG